eukprot:1141826-Pelagomonas_calceolata.AAC.2
MPRNARPRAFSRLLCEASVLSENLVFSTTVAPQQQSLAAHSGSPRPAAPARALATKALPLRLAC